MQVRLLGRFDVVAGNGSVCLGGHRQRAVLAVLAVHANEVVSADRLADEVWSGLPPPTARGTLQRYISHLRQALEGTDAVIETQRPGYVLRVPADAVDARRFERLVADARTHLRAGAVEQAAALLHEALDLWRGEPRADALRVYGEGRRLLADELGLDPSTRLQELETAILLKDPAVEPPAPPAPTRLPVERTSFVGRADEVREVADLLGDCRLVTLTGAGGSGKSRLALRVAAGGQRAWFVELSTVGDPSLVARTVAVAIGARDDPEREVDEVVVDAMAHHGRGLLVLDGCEHLLDAVVPLVEAVLAQVAHARILVTSREPLGVAGESVYRVPTLPVPPPDCDEAIEAVGAFDATRLFLDRAAAADARFRPGDDDAAAVAAVCRRLDGLPLALELAAARMDVLTPRELLRRLDHLDVLRAPGRTELPRHRTLRAAIEWSYELLREDERLLFERLSVFAGSFDIETAEAVCADDRIPQAHVFELLARLVRKSLVVRVDAAHPEARYRLLDTLRDYGRERLVERGVDAEAHGRHAAWFTELVERTAPAVRAPGAGPLLHELDARQVEFRAALAWLLDRGDAEAACRLAAALANYWDYRFQVRDGRMWLGRVIRVARETGLAPSRALVWVTIAAAYFAFMDDERAEAAVRCDEALALLEDVPDDLARGRVLTIRGESARHDGDVELAERLCREAAALCHAVGDPWSEGDAIRVLAQIATDTGDIEASLTLAEQCLALYRESNDVEKIAGAQGMYAGLLRDRGCFDEAVRLMEDSVGRFQQAGEPLGTAFMLWQLGGLAVLQGEPDRAVPLAEAGLQISEEIAFLRGIAQASLVLAEAHLLAGRLEEAELWCNRAVARSTERGFAADLVLALETAVLVRLARDDAHGAALYADQALSHARTRGYAALTGRVLCLVARARVRQARLAEAEAAATEAIELLRRAGLPRWVAVARVALAEVALAAGDADTAVDHLRAARDVLAESGAALAQREQDYLAQVAAAIGRPLAPLL